MIDKKLDIDPVKYEVFSHRLYRILEEGRLAIRMTSGSAVVVEGGETMCAFYQPDGTSIQIAAGILLHATGGTDYIRKTHEWYAEDPGIHDGDQFIFNDPYLGGVHQPDVMVVKPIFYGGELIAWTGSMMHTPETGAISPGGMPGNATEVFHEGIRLAGLKIVEGGHFRKEVFNTIVRQVRDQVLMGLDIKAKLAANNVCARRYLELVEKFGLDFVHLASQKIIEDVAALAKAKLRRLPDGTWRSRLYGDMPSSTREPIKVICTMTKQGEKVTFDFTGSSQQISGPGNCTFSTTWGSLFVTLCSQLFFDLPWNGGMTETVNVVLPEGTVVNCKYPAACSAGVIAAGKMVSCAAHECIAKMFYAAGELKSVNAGWHGMGIGGPSFGGVGQYGYPVAGNILDTFAAGIGATPQRDGVDTGGNMMNPQSSIADVEILELNIPIMYLSRRQAADSGGFGEFRSGMGPEVIYMFYGTDNFCTGNSAGGVRIPQSFGLFGGYPPALQAAVYCLNSDVRSWFVESRVPLKLEDLFELKGKIYHYRTTEMTPVEVKSYDLLYQRYGAGGGFGDPLDRNQENVLKDLKIGATFKSTAEQVYGVVIDEADMKVRVKETQELRLQLRGRRIGRKDVESTPPAPCSEGGFRIHPCLEVVSQRESKVIRCCRCGYVFGPAADNYKRSAAMAVGIPESWPLRRPVSGDAPLGVYQQWYCPGCGTLLQVDIVCPELEREEDMALWDISVTVH